VAEVSEGWTVEWFDKLTWIHFTSIHTKWL